MIKYIHIFRGKKKKKAEAETSQKKKKRKRSNAHIKGAANSPADAPLEHYWGPNPGSPLYHPNDKGETQFKAETSAAPGKVT